MSLRFFALRRSSALLLTLGAAIALTACAGGDTGGDGGDGGDDAAESVAADGGAQDGTATVEDGAVMVMAADMAFDASTIEATAGEAFVITFMNNDSAPHNISVYEEEGGEAIVEGAVIEGDQQTEVEVPALDAGEYYFQCDVHPNMNGTVAAS